MYIKPNRKSYWSESTTEYYDEEAEYYDEESEYI